jgi:hypothetical protein
MNTCEGFINVEQNLPQSEQKLSGAGSYYFSPKLIVVVGKRKYKTTFQIEKKQFYREGDNFGREDFGHLSPSCWKYLNT